jgi:hypothetical protein
MTMHPENAPDAAEVIDKSRQQQLRKTSVKEIARRVKEKKARQQASIGQGHQGKGQGVASAKDRSRQAPPLKAFMEVADTVPEGRRAELLDMMESFAEKAKTQPANPLPTTHAEMEALGMELYPAFVKRTGATDGKACLAANWGPWLKAFTPSLDRDHMSKADLGRLDPQLLARLRKQHPKDELHGFLPSLPLLNQQIVDTMSDEEKRDVYRKNTMLARKLGVS